MGEHISFLISFVSNDGTDRLIKVVLKIKKDKLSGDCVEYPRKPENRKQLLGYLPQHVQTFCEKIVDVEKLFEATVV